MEHVKHPQKLAPKIQKLRFTNKDPPFFICVRPQYMIITRQLVLLIIIIWLLLSIHLIMKLYLTFVLDALQINYQLFKLIVILREFAMKISPQFGLYLVQDNFIRKLIIFLLSLLVLLLQLSLFKILIIANLLI